MAVEEFKVILVGESGVGKTSFVIRFADSKFQNVYESTVGVDCKKVQVTIEDKQVDLQIWDTAGQERFKSIIFRSADGAIIMYDVTKKETFDEIPWWVKETREHLSGIPIFLVGNKNDDGSQPEVLEELAQDLAEENRLYLYHTSAKDNLNVSEVFNDLAIMMLADRKKAQEPDESTKLCERSIDSAYDVRKVYLTADPKPSKKSCCSYFESPDTKAHVI
ncbi:ras-related protein Rab-13 [Caerostris extrusa]|uniref:Ras-related protein Rab-13 n=1 Tax=Caerostris extrusa TaxID=172846 RepID=A0AAV4PN04_CAEEX|nr:ras-related protein Rab-13 [Caerostris extrusa]